MAKHLGLLDKADLKTSGWTTRPLQNCDHDFVSKLHDRYLADLDSRIKKHAAKDATISHQLRKAAALIDSEELLNTQY